MIYSGRLIALRHFGKIAFFDLALTDKIIEFVVTDATHLDAFKHLKLGTLLTLSSDEVNERNKPILQEFKVDSLPTGNFLKYDLIKDRELRYKNRALCLATNLEERKVVLFRSKVLKIIRSVLDDCVQIDTPVLQQCYGGASARPFVTSCNYNGKQYFLRICHQFPLKKMMIAGLAKVFCIGAVFRNEDLDRTHSPQYSLMECYRINETYEDAIAITQKIVRLCAAELAVKSIGSQLLSDPWPRVSYRQIVQKLKLPENNVIENLKKVEAFVEQEWAEGCVHLVDIPAVIMPLAKDNNGYAYYADSYVKGVQLATQYTEENDPVSLRAKWVEYEKIANLEGKSLVNEQFLTDLSIGMPHCCGMGLGVDRLVMLLANTPSIRDAQNFPLV